MTRLLPRSLFGQTLLILLAGLIVSHAVGSWIYTADREQAVRAVGGFATAQRIANLDPPGPGHPARSRGNASSPRSSDQSFPGLALRRSLRAITASRTTTHLSRKRSGISLSSACLSGPARQAARAGIRRADGPPFGPWHDDGARPHDAWLRRLRGLPRPASRDPPGGWPVALVCDCPAGRRSRVLVSVPSLDGRHGDHHSRRVRVGRPARDRTARPRWRRLPSGSATM